jgi:hypothetical protein
MTPTEQLTEIISQILDDANHLTDINMGSEAGRQIVAATVASQMIDGPDVLVVDATNSTDEERQAIDTALESHPMRDDSTESQDVDAALFEGSEVFP